MIKLLVLSVLLPVSALAIRAENSVEVEMKKTLACHQSFKSHAHENYEVWDKDGLIFGRWIGSRKVQGWDETQSMVNLSFTDGKNVLLAQVPSPVSTRQDGTKTSKFYYQEHIFKLQVPALNGGVAKNYCVNYKPQLGNDNLKRYEAAPPAKCDDAQVIDAKPVSDKEAMSSLEKIQLRIADSIELQVHKMKRCREEKSCSSDKDEDKLLGFDPAACRGLTGYPLTAALEKYDAFAKKHNLSGTSGAAPVVDENGVQ